MKKENNIELLVDIRDICVNTNLPKEERIKEYLKQIKDPYNFRCGAFNVSISFTDNGLSFEDALANVLI